MRTRTGKRYAFFLYFVYLLTDQSMTNYHEVRVLTDLRIVPPAGRSITTTLTPGFGWSELPAASDIGGSEAYRVALVFCRIWIRIFNVGKWNLVEKLLVVPIR